MGGGGATGYQWGLLGDGEWATKLPVLFQSCLLWVMCMTSHFHLCLLQDVYLTFLGMIPDIC